MEQSNIIIYNTPDGKARVTLYARDGNVWMNQNQIAELFDTSVPNISMHMMKILRDNELSEKSVVKYYLTTASDGKQYDVAFYSLEMILAIGFRVRSKRGTQFRIWANTTLKAYMQKGFVIDDERLKNADGRPDYFDELLERIRDIRASEKRFYQKIKDLLSLSSDYDASDKATQMFFAETQNKLLYAVTQLTAAEIVMKRANPELPNMGLTAWKGNIVRKGDIIIAKNYLSENEIDTLNRLTVIFLETAELRVKEHKDLNLDFWKNQVNKILEFNDRNVLKHTGSISHEEMEKRAAELYEQFNTKRKLFEAQQADEQDKRELQADKELKELQDTIKKRESES
ncbi:MAG: virulence RhuM family protein [Bacteroidetes bacterium]|nr:virulence RhuM family protein [Bacteroidota bacterium]